MATRPSTTSDWSSAPGAPNPRIEPSAGEKTAGFAPLGRMSAATANWLWWDIDQWQKWLDEFIGGY
jgi:hypothetical protein